MYRKLIENYNEGKMYGEKKKIKIKIKKKSPHNNHSLSCNE
jgi:hypothetical protein